MDLNKIMGALGSSGVAGGLAGGAAGGALTGVLMNKSGRKTAKNLLAAGGLAALGGLAWKAYRNYQDKSVEGEAAVETASAAANVALPPAQAGWSSLKKNDFAIPSASSEGSKGLLLIRAMITAAMADGHMDNTERTAILNRLDALNLDADEKALVVDEILHPKSLADIVRSVVDQESAIEVYAASVLAIDESRPEAAAYLDDLARQLSLPPLLVEALQSRVAEIPTSNPEAA